VRTTAGLHLTYCTNIHPADGWPAVFASLRQHAPALKARLSPDSPFGIGLRLSAHDANGLSPGACDAFKEWLHREGLYVALINGFPYGPFHGTPVKAAVYAPDWRDPARLAYTLRLIAILGRLLPDGIDGGVSTAPLSYKSWIASTGGRADDAFVRNIVDVAAALVAIRRADGRVLHLDIEPEPDCVLETTDETVAWFEGSLIRTGAPLLAARLGVSADRAAEHLLDHIRVCFDCCHVSVEHEDPMAAIDRLHAAGIQIGRVQLSSALSVAVPADAGAAAPILERLGRFADATYLHQVVVRDGARLEHAPDLDVALAGARPGEWRVHFHVPLFTREYDGLGSSQADVRRVIERAVRQPFTTHLEIETYTWDVLPPGLKLDLDESIAREYAWVLDAMRA
jgi:sugar phosphate isomerase/epimerase